MDFLIESGKSIYPLEVKSGSAGKLKSLSYFLHEKKTRVGIRMSLDPFGKISVSNSIVGEKLNYELYTLPLYAIEGIKTLLTQIE